MGIHEDMIRGALADHDNKKIESLRQETETPKTVYANSEFAMEYKMPGKRPLEVFPGIKQQNDAADRARGAQNEARRSAKGSKR